MSNDNQSLLPAEPNSISLASQAEKLYDMFYENPNNDHSQEHDDIDMEVYFFWVNKYKSWPQNGTEKIIAWTFDLLYLLEQRLLIVYSMYLAYSTGVK